MHIGIVGAGLLGRVLSIKLTKLGHKIDLFDKDSALNSTAAGNSAAGMIALFAELESAESIIFDKGKRSLELWPEILKELKIEDAFMQKGTIITAHPQDYGELEHFIDTLVAKVDEAKSIKLLNSNELAKLESDLSHHKRAFYIPKEGVVDAQRFMSVSASYLLSDPKVNWHQNCEVLDIDEYRGAFDLLFDLRGVGANSIDDLRGVRGEVIHIHSHEVNITRPTRMMHPRYKLYIVPRGDGRYIIGASEIESEDRSPISLRSSLELLSALYALHPSFGEARIIKCDTNLRPALSDNLPRVKKDKNLITINGLYRHGYLMAPAIVEEVIKEIF